MGSVFWSNHVVLQPCWFSDVILCVLPGNFPSGVDKINPTIGVNLFFYAAARREFAHILRSEICSDVCSPSFIDALSCAD